MSFLRNGWYVAAWADELNSGTLARTIIGDAVLFWHAEGALFAVADRCPHRLAPLHMGRVDGPTVRCGYHGLEFSGASGSAHTTLTAPSRAHCRSAPIRVSNATASSGSGWESRNGPIRMAFPI